MRRAAAKSLRRFSLILFYLLILTGYAKIDAASSLDVVINEIAWMGTQASAYDEWLEFYNNTGDPIDIGNWSIYGADTEECLNFSDADGTNTTILPAHGYLIYANEKDNVKNSSGISIVDIWDKTIGLNNSSPGQVTLYDDPNCGGNVIDTANSDGGEWPAGDKDTKSTMERIDPFSPDTNDNWATNNGEIINGEDANGDPINGTPKAQNSVTNFPPVADANGPYSCSVGEDITLNGSGSSDSDGTITDYEWDYDGDGQYNDAIGVTPTYNCTSSGSHPIGLKVTDDDGATDTDSTTVNVNQPPVADAGGPYSCTVGDAINLDGSGSSDSDGSISNYEWDLNNNGQYDDATGVSPSYSCSTAGSHTVGLKVTDDDNATDTDGTTVNVNSPPTANFTYSPSSPTTQDTIQFTDQSTDSDGEVTSWDWDFGDGNTSTAQNPNHQYANDGTYTVTLIVADDNGATDTATKQITIGEPLSLGDPDGDGEITMEDANLAAEYALEIETPTDAQREAADVVAPFGVIDIRDAIAIAEVAQGLRSGFD